MDEQDLLDLKNDIDEAKSEASKLEGRKEHLLQELEEKWGCSSLKEAKEKLEELKQQVDKIDQKIQNGIQKLEENYEL